jgi:hypothetical protein
MRGDMKLKIIAIFSVLFSFSANLFASEMQARIAINTYLNGLVSGDIRMIKSLAAKNFAERLKHIDNNPDYSNFLKSKYHNVNLSITDVAGRDPSYQVQVSALSSNGEQEVFIFTVEEVNGNWLITNEK